MASKVAVLGAGGGTGKACLEQLLQQGCTVRAVVRDPEKFKAGLPGFNAMRTDVAWLHCGEELLRKSGVPYTVVRSGGLTNDPAGQAQLVADQGDRSVGRVSRADVAAVCCAALGDPAAKGVTLELSSQPFQGAPVPLAEQLRGIFQGLKPDAAV